MAGSYDATLQSGYPRNVTNLEQIMDAPCPDHVLDAGRICAWSFSAGTSLSDFVGQLWPFVIFLGKRNDSTCLRVDCGRSSRLSPLRVVLLFLFVKFHSSAVLICRGIYSPLAFPMADVPPGL